MMGSSVRVRYAHTCTHTHTYAYTYTNLDVGHRAEVVDLVGADLGDELREVRGVRQVAVVQEEVHAWRVVMGWTQRQSGQSVGSRDLYMPMPIQDPVDRSSRSIPRTPIHNTAQHHPVSQSIARMHAPALWRSL